MNDNTLLQSSALITLLENTPDIMFIKDISLRYIGVSKTFAKLTNIDDPHLIIGKTDFDLFENHSLAERYVEDDRNILLSGRNLINYIEPLPDKDGVPRYSSTSKYIIRDAEGNPTGIYGISRNMTDEINLVYENLRLQFNEHHLKMVLQNTAVSILEYDYATRTIHMTNRSGSNLGEQRIIRDVPESLVEEGYVHPESADKFLDMYRRLREGAPEAEGIFMMKHPGSEDYSYDHVHYNNLFDSNKQPYKAIGISEDVTEQQRARINYERELEYRLSLSQNTCCITLFDLTDDIVIKRVFKDEVSSLSLTKAHNVDEYAGAIGQILVEDEQSKSFLSAFSIPRLKELYECGSHDDSFEFCLKMPDGLQKWIKNDCYFVCNPTNGHLMMISSLFDIDEDLQSRRRLMIAAEHDAMTGLLNHVSVLEKIERFLAEHSDRHHAVFMIDLDNFKSINDTFGHMCGDKVIKDIASIIRRSFRTDDIVGRVGGDEFIALMKNIPGKEQVRKKASELREALEYVCTVDGISIELSASVGVRIYTGDDTPMQTLQSDADASLYKAKESGKNRYAIWDDKTGGPAPQPSFPEHSTMVQLKALLEHMEGGVILADVLEGIKITYTSPGLFKSIGYAPGESLDFFSTVLPEDLPYLKQIIIDSAKSNSPIDYTYRGISSEGGLPVWYHLSGGLISDETGLSHHVIGVITNIDCLKRNEQQLKLAEERYRIALEQSGLYLWEIDIPEDTLVLSQNIAKRLGVSNNVIKGFSSTSYRDHHIHEDSKDAFNALIRSIMNGEPSGEAVLKKISPDGTVKPAKYSFKMTYDDSGMPYRAIGTITPL
ncbi:MAG: diguanylate cyclase [Clostridiaceae bacterium]|nr:diguanylate cyclase [Clostridiaceae bacterium]